MIIQSKYFDDEFINGTYQVWKRNFKAFKADFFRNILWIVLEPLTIFLAIGYGLGSFISSMQGVTYADYFFISILGMSSSLISFSEAAYGGFNKLKVNHTFAVMLTTRLEISQIVIGEIIWAASKGLMSSIGIGIIGGGLLGHLDSPGYFVVLIALALSSIVFGAFGFWVSTLVQKSESIIFPMSVVIVPILLFSGTYFSIENLPYGLKYLLYISPLTHSLVVSRFAVFGDGLGWVVTFNFLFLILMILVFIKLSIKRFKTLEVFKIFN